MTIGALIEVLTAFFKFPAAVTALIKMIKQTPEEQHEALIKQVQAVFDESKNNGRPNW